MTTQQLAAALDAVAALGTTAHLFIHRVPTEVMREIDASLDDDELAERWSGSREGPCLQGRWREVLVTLFQAQDPEAA